MSAMTISAQTDNRSAEDISKPSDRKYRVFTNGFWNNWFLSANLSGKSFYSNEENDLSPKISGSPFRNFRTNLGLSASVGKWFTPGIGLRTKLTGFWGKHILSDDANMNAIRYWNIQEQVLFNLNNIFAGYNENRVWAITAYAGVGLLRNCSDNEYAHGATIGLMNTWKINSRLDFNIDFGLYVSDDDIDGAARTNTNEYAISLSTADRSFYTEIGLTYHLGKRKWKKTDDYYSTIEQLNQAVDLNNSLHSQLQECEKLRDEAIAKLDSTESKTVIVEKHIVAPVSIFFQLGRSSVNSRKDLQNVKELVAVAKELHSKVIIRGYADIKTGSQEYNMELSLKRANAVAAKIVSMGIPFEDIEVLGEGGVDKWEPSSYNRRVVVSIEE